MLLTPPPRTGVIRFRMEDELAVLVIAFDFGWIAGCVFLPNRPLSLELLYLVDPVEAGRRDTVVVGRRCEDCDREWGGRVLPRFAIISSNEESRSMNVKQV